MWPWNRYALTDIARTNFENWGRMSAVNLRLGSEFLKAQSNFMPDGFYKDWAKMTSTQMSASAQMFQDNSRRYTAPPPFNITDTTEQAILDVPFYKLTRFETSSSSKNKKPKLLIVAPMSGHYASLLRSTVEGMMPTHDVHMLEWNNPRDISTREGVFDFEKYMECLAEAMEKMGPDTHVMGISQSTVPLLAVSAHFAQNKNAATPKSITLIGGPIDTRQSQSPIHDFARNVSDDWLKSQITDAVPAWYKGHGRRVYPGFTQLIALMNHGRDKHQDRLAQLYGALVEKDVKSSAEFKSFYKDYLAAMDLDEAFFLDTLRHVYREHSLASGTMTFRGQTVDLGALKNTALMTVEGANDEIALPGETHAAQDLCPNIPQNKRVKFTHPSYGHYGIAMGTRFQNEIAPRIAAFTTDIKTPPTPKPPRR